MGDKPGWHLYYKGNHGKNVNHYPLDEYLGSVFDNWVEWPDMGEMREGVSQRIDLRKDLFEGDIVEVAPAKGFKPRVKRFSGNRFDFYWIHQDERDERKKYLAHSYVNQGVDGRPQFRVVVEANIIAGSRVFQNPRKGSEDIYQRQ